MAKHTKHNPKEGGSEKPYPYKFLANHDRWVWREAVRMPSRIPVGCRFRKAQWVYDGDWNWLTNLQTLLHRVLDTTGGGAENAFFPQRHEQNALRNLHYRYEFSIRAAIEFWVDSVETQVWNHVNRTHKSNGKTERDAAKLADAAVAEFWKLLP